ncbi:MAG: hypothetical protein K0S00_1942 [Xanthobacteraceae bacterium]|jgi:hypothetical protein|nr:hypothetical protein [Xanthobacteraceae bacterium]
MDDLRVICVECTCGRRWWGRSSEVGFRSIQELAGRMICRGCGARNVSVAYAEQVAVPAPVLNELWATVEIWDDAGIHIHETMARVGNLGVGVAAYERTLLERPNRNVTLRDGARIIRSTERDRERRGKGSD